MENGAAPAPPSAKDPKPKRKRAAAAKRRSWKRADIPIVTRGVSVTDGTIAIVVSGPDEERVEAIVDQLLRELPE